MIPLKQNLCEQQTGQFYSSLEERQTSMLSLDEHAGELEICGLVHSSCCSMLLYQVQNCIPQCCGKYGGEQFLNVESSRNLYYPDQPNQPSHYDILVNPYSNIPHIKNTI